MLTFGKRGRRGAEAEAEEAGGRRSKEEQVQELIALFDEAARCRDEEEALQLFDDIVKSPLVHSDDSIPAVAKVKRLSLKSMGAIYERRDDESCLECYSLALDLDESDVTLAFRMAQFCVRKHFIALGRATLERALRKDPTFWPALATLLELVYSLKDPVSCVTVANRCLQIQPHNARALEIRRMALARQPVGLDARISVAMTPVAPVHRERNIGEVRIGTLSWEGVLSAVSSKLKDKDSQSQLLRVSWATAARPAPIDSAPEKGKESAQPTESPEEEKRSKNVGDGHDDNDATAVAAAAAEKPEETNQPRAPVLRADEDARKQQELADRLDGFLPPLDSAGAEDDEDDNDDSDDDDSDAVGVNAAEDASDAGESSKKRRKTGKASPSKAPSSKSAALNREEADAVELWLQQTCKETLWESLELVDAVFAQVFALRSPWTKSMQRSGRLLMQQLLKWDVMARPYYLALAELESSWRKSRDAAGVCQRLLDKFVFEFPSYVAQPSRLLIRMERIKGIMCKFLDRPNEALCHLNVVLAMMEHLAMAETDSIVLPHAREAISRGSVELSIISLGDSSRAKEAMDAFAEKKYERAVELWLPLLLSGSDQSVLKAADRSKMLKKLGKALEILGRTSELVQVLVARVRLRVGGDSTLLDLLQKVRRMPVGVWTNQQRRVVQKEAHAIVCAAVGAKGSPQQSLRVVSAWLTIFYFLPRPLTSEGLKLLAYAEGMIFERVDVRRAEDKQFLRMVVTEMQTGLVQYDSEEGQVESWQESLHTALHLLYDVKLPSQRKSLTATRNKKRNNDVTQELMADAYTLVGDMLSDQDMCNLVRKIHARFSQLPTTLQDRLDQLTNFVEHGTSSDEAEMQAISAFPGADQVLKGVPFAHVYKDIYSLLVNQTVPHKYVRAPQNRPRIQLRRIAVKKWFEAKSFEECKRALLMDVSVNPQRFDSWFLLGEVFRGKADHLAALGVTSLDRMTSEERALIAECRTCATRCFLMSLHCTVEPKDRKQRAEALVLIGLQQLAASRLTADPESKRQLWSSGLDMCERAKESYPTLWLAWYVGALLKRKLRIDPRSYLADLAHAMTLPSQKGKENASHVKEKTAQLKLHALRAKLFLDGSLTHAELNDFPHANPMGSDDPEQTQRSAVVEDICDGLHAGASKAEQGLHHVNYLCSRLIRCMAEGADDASTHLKSALDMLEDLLLKPNSKIPLRLQSSSAIVHVVVGDLEGYGLTEGQLNQRMTRKILAEYLDALDALPSLERAHFVFQRLMKHCENDPQNTFRDELKKSAVVLFKMCESSPNQSRPTVESEEQKDENVAISEKEDAVQANKVLLAALELREVVTKHADFRDGPLNVDAVNNLLLQFLPAHLRDTNSPERAAAVHLRIAKSVATPEADSPNYSAIRRKPKKAASSRDEDEQEKVAEDEAAAAGQKESPDYEMLRRKPKKRARPPEDD